MARQGRRAGFIREKRPGLWEISAEGAPGPDGRRRRKWQTVRGGRRDAERALAILIADLADGRVDPGAGTFTELLEDWWSTKRAARWEDATAIRHRQDIDTHLSPALGRRPVDSLRPADFTRLYARMTAVGCAPRTVQHVHGTARAAIKFGIAQGLLTRNVTDAADVPVRRRARRPLPTLAQLEAVLHAAAGDGNGMWGAWFRVAFYTGARPAEVCALRWVDVDIDRAELHYRRAIGRQLLADGRQGWKVKGTKTQSASSDGERTVAIDLGTAAVLRRWRAAVLEQRLAAGVQLDPELVVFPAGGFGDRPMVPATPTRRWRRYAAPAGVDPEVRLYDAARHHHISWALTAGFPVAEVAERVGNSPETIYRTYAHLLGGDTRRIAAALDEADRQLRAVGAGSPMLRLQDIAHIATVNHCEHTARTGLPAGALRAPPR